jgi:hypothetical protein
MHSFPLRSLLVRSFAIGLTALLISACGSDAGHEDVTGDTASSARVEEASNDAAEDQVERMKPAAGTGNVQGKILYNGKPAADIEVTLCEEFSRFGSGCGGKTFTAKTDANGEYVITNVPPKQYAALLAKVFETEGYVFATKGIGISSETYDVESDKTLFVRPTNLFKSDLKVSNPKAGSRVSAAGMTLAWDAYPDAEYYKFSLFPDSSAVVSPYINERVDSNGFALTKQLVPGEYRFEVEAFNADDIKLSESSDDITFTVN